jgi:hypothetical protein
MIVKIGNKKYQIPNGHSDITLETYAKLHKVILDNKDNLEGDNAYQVTIRLMDVLGIPPQVSLKAHPDDIPQLLNYIVSIITPPKEDVKVTKRLRIGANKYTLNTNNKDFLGNLKAFTDMTFEEFEDSISIVRMADEGMDNLHLLMGIFYRPTNWLGFPAKYDSKKVPDIAEKMKSVTMDKVFGFYFFLINLMTCFSKDIQHYLRVEEKRELEMLGI